MDIRSHELDGPTSLASSFTLELNLKVVGGPFWAVLGIVPLGLGSSRYRGGSSARFLKTRVCFGGWRSCLPAVSEAVLSASEGE